MDFPVSNFCFKKNWDLMDNLLLSLAQQNETPMVIDFLNQYIDQDTEGAWNDEFRCPYGITRAIKRKQMIITKKGNSIVGALRFYPQKRKNIVSVYQFAVKESERGNDLVKKMLECTDGEVFHSRCPENIKFNDYYLKTGWKLFKTDDLGNVWELNLW